MSTLDWILTLIIVAGQLIRIPLLSGAVNLLDMVVIILCLVGLFQAKLQLKKPPPFILSALIFIVIALISLTFTPLNLSYNEYLASLFYTIRFTLYILLGWLLLGTLPSLRKNINQILLFSGIGLAILGLLQFIFWPDLRFLTAQGWDPHYFRTVSTFLDPNFAGAFFVLTLILLYQNYAMAKKWYIVSFLVLYITLLTTFSRSSYLMFLISGSVLSFLKKSKNLFLIVGWLFIGLMLGFQLYTMIISKPRNIDRSQSAQFRLSTWQQGWQIFQSHILLGVGYNSYRYALKQYHLGDEQFIKSHGASSNDSSLLQVAATTGVIGLISFIFFLFTLIKDIKGNLILASAVFGLIVHSFFANSLFFPPILIWIILAKVSGTKN